MLGLLDTTVNGPAPTGFCLNAFSPILSKDVFDAIQFRFAEMNDRLIAANGAVKWISTVSVPDVVTAGFSSFGQLLFGLQVHGDASERSKFHLTVSASNGLPSVNFTPGRSLMRERLAVGGQRRALGELALDLPALHELEQLPVDRVHHRLVRGAVRVGRRIEAGGPRAREAGVLQDGDLAAALRGRRVVRSGVPGAVVGRVSAAATTGCKRYHERRKNAERDRLEPVHHTLLLPSCATGSPPGTRSLSANVAQVRRP